MSYSPHPSPPPASMFSIIGLRLCYSKKPFSQIPVPSMKPSSPSTPCHSYAGCACSGPREREVGRFLPICVWGTKKGNFRAGLVFLLLEIELGLRDEDSIQQWVRNQKKTLSHFINEIPPTFLTNLGLPPSYLPFRALTVPPSLLYLRRQ